MAVKKIVQLTCDRCGNVMDEGGDAEGIDSDEAPIKLLIEGDDLGVQKVEFYDVCEKCTSRIKALVDQITLEKSDTPAPKKRKAKGADEANGSEPTPPEAPQEAATAPN